MLVNTLSQTNIFAIDTLKGIHVLEADMGDVIEELKANRQIAFAHTISGDFHHPRQITAGVSVVFKTRFGKPQNTDYVTRHLACQKTSDGVTIYSLVTKANYYGKPIVRDYNMAIEDMTHKFYQDGFRTLLCSPMRCVRDLIEFHHFAKKIEEFHGATGAVVVIGNNDHKAR